MNRRTIRRSLAELKRRTSEGGAAILPSSHVSVNGGDEFALVVIGLSVDTVLDTHTRSIAIQRLRWKSASTVILSWGCLVV
jgi:hypothetical protein